MTSGGAVRVAVLGPVTVEDEAGEAALTPQLRKLLGVLVVADGVAVSADRLAEVVFEGPVEGSALRTAVSRLRKLLGERIVSEGGAYRLLLEADELDAARFEQLVTRAKSAPAEARVASLTRAVQLWRGPALGDLGDEHWSCGWAARMNGLRASTVEDLGETLLEVGHARDAIGLLAEHVRENPYRERPVRLLMQALASDGRVADALREFERFRVILRDDTGLDPSAELRAVEASLLASTSPTQGVKASLPEGTVTFLFTDIEGSTQRWADDEGAMIGALAAHDEVLRSTVESHGGIVFKHTGDGICAVFTSVPAAVAAAVSAQAQLQLPVRMGLHTGEAERRDRDYFGPTLNRVARIMDAGHGGQILLSRAVMALAGADDVTDLGEHRLRGLANPEQIWQVGTRKFPALRTVSAHKGNLPAELSAFVGRNRELDELAHFVASRRLVTLIGVGGTGKTRLAIEAARRLAPTFPDGCWLVDLSQVATPDAVPHAICIGLGLTVPEHDDVLRHVVQLLSRRRLVVVVDNCEHLIDGAARAIEKIVAGCPAVTVLATSREPLMVDGEQLVPTPSMSLDDAIGLFVTRAKTEAPDLPLDDRQQEAVVAICERLDRIPLAIELAASRVRSMSPIDILGRLDERFRLLVGGRRYRMERHQTMRGALDWSYDLCSPTDRRVFDRVSVFVGDFDHTAARAVAANGPVDGVDVDDALDRLVDRSLVQRVVDVTGASHFRLLETMRAYGHDHLVEQSAADEVRSAHAAHLAETALALNLQSCGPDEVLANRRLLALTPEILLALDWCIDQGDWYRAFRLARSCSFASEGITIAMGRRIAAGALARDGDFAAFDPCMRAMFESAYAPDLTALWWKEPSEATRDRIIPLLAGPCTLPPDHGGTPADFLQTLSEADIEVVDAFIERFRDVNFGVYASNLVGYHHALVESGWQDRVLADRPRVQSVLDQVRSETLQRTMLGVWSIAHEAAGDHATAADLIGQLSLDQVEHPTVEDFLNACRSVRMRARVGGRVTATDVRRMVDWFTSGGYWMWRPSLALSLALALLSLERPDLAARAMNLIRLDEFQEFLERIGEIHGPEFVALVANRTGDEEIDVVVAAVLAFLDDLDRTR